MKANNSVYKKCGRIFTEKEINIIIAIAKEKYSTCRCEISRAVCKALNWYSDNGKPKEWVCREFLLQLERQNLISLPAPQPQSFRRFNKKKFDRIIFKEPEVPLKGTLGDFSNPIFKRLSNPSENTLWEYLVGRYHYLGYKGLMGRFMKYMVYIDDTAVACTSFTDAALRVFARDSWLGWDDTARKSALKHIANNFRFVIFPWVEIKYLASHILSKNVRILREDWKRQYNVDIYLLETFIERDRFEGTCYKASNWKCVGQTRGFAKTKNAYHKHGIIKDMYMHPLCKKYRELLQCNL